MLRHLAVFGLLQVPQWAPPELVAARVAKLPAIDGKADDEAWKQAKELVVKIDKPTDLDNPKNKVSLKAVHDGDSICFLLVWEDMTKNDQHKSYVWKDDQGKYEEDDEELEDVAALAFPLEGLFDADMRAGIESKWDVWEWAAFRANSGYARDKVHIYSKRKPPDPIKSKRVQDRNEGTIFIARPDDEGTPPAKHLDPPAQKKGAKIPQWEPQTPTGSAADVQAKGAWANGKWTVEFRRKLNSGHKDDATLSPGKSIEFAVATFDAVEHSDHDVSRKLLLKIQ